MLTIYERSRSSCQLADRPCQVVPRILQHDAAGRNGGALHPGRAAEDVAKRYNVSRLAQDEYSLESQQRTARAQAEGFFGGEIAPMKVTKAVLDKKTGEKIGTQEVCCDRDECNRPDTSLEALLVL